MVCIDKIVNQSTADLTNSSLFSLTPEPEALRITRSVLFSLIAALALVGNFVVCRAVWRNPGPKPIAHYLVSNLAFAEIVSMVCLVFTFHAYEPPYSWKLGHVMCKILDPLQVASLLVVTTTLAILAVYRCVLLTKPMVRKPTRRQTCCVILVSWVGAVGLSVPAAHFRVVNSYGDKCEIRYCEEVFPEGLKHYQNTYSVVLFVINFALPLVIMMISYSLVSKKIREHIFVIRRIQDEQSMALSSVARTTVLEEIQELGANRIGKNQVATEPINVAVDTEMAAKKSQSSHSGHNNTIELENDLLRMVYALVLTFIVCYIPYQVQFLMIEFNFEAFRCWPHRYTFNRLVFTLTCLPSALHPVFYGTMSKFYRKAFLKIIACRFSE